MRVVVGLVAAVALAACGGGDAAPRATPSATGTPTASQELPDDAMVRAAVEKTRAAKTGRYVVVSATELSMGKLVVRREGWYDLGRLRGSVDQSFAAEPSELLTAITKAGAGEADSRTVVTKTHTYLQMKAWTGKEKGRWLAYTTAELDKVREFEVDPAETIFPAQLELLSEAVPSPKADQDPAVAHVEVPAWAAFLAIPSNTVQKLVAKGVTKEDIDGTVEVTVELRDGLVTRVTFDPANAYIQALAAAGNEGAASDDLAGLPTTIEVSRHGDPAPIKVPPASAVMPP